MSYTGRFAMLALALAAAAAVVGCGETVIDDVKTEEAIQQNLASSLGKRVETVECPSGVEVEPRSTFECTVTLSGGKEETAELRIVNEDADVEVVDLSADK